MRTRGVCGTCERTHSRPEEAEVARAEAPGARDLSPAGVRPVDGNESERRGTASASLHGARWARESVSGTAWVYYSVFNFWARPGLVRESSEDRAWTGSMVVSFLQLLLVLGVYLLAEEWLGIGPPPRWARLPAIVVIGSPNCVPARRRTWKAFSDALSASPAEVRRRSLAVGAATSFLVVAFFLAAVWVFRGWN